jgi:hypothetical protein
MQISRLLRLLEDDGTVEDPILTDDGDWLHRMEQLGWITIHRPRHAATGYGPEEWSLVDECEAFEEGEA